LVIMSFSQKALPKRLVKIAFSERAFWVQEFFQTIVNQTLI